MESVPTQKFVNIIIRNSRNIQVYQVSQILLSSSSGLMGVSCLQDPLFDSWWCRFDWCCFYYFPITLFSSFAWSSICSDVVTHIYKYYPWLCRKSSKLENKQKFGGCQNSRQIDLKILSIRIIRIIRKKSLIRTNRIFGQLINKDNKEVGAVPVPVL